MNVETLIREHLKRRPLAQTRDVYKLLYQGVFGVGHIVSEKAWDILVEEANKINLDEHKEDQLIEQVSPDGSMVRVNLRQYLNRGGGLRTLYEVMLESGRHVGDKDVFLRYWGEYRRLVFEGILPGIREEIAALDGEISKNGVKPMHHTEQYREAYYPAYRVVLRRKLDKELLRG
jgi:hypothetical protein